MQKNEAQISRVAVVEKGPSPWKKILSTKKKIPSSLFVQVRPTKWCAEIFLK